MARDSDRLAVWDAKARALIDRIDSVLGEEHDATPGPDTSVQLDAMTRRVMLRTPRPSGKVFPTPPPNMGPQPDRLDHWDAYVCRFDAGEEAGA